MQKPDLKSMTLSRLEALMQELGEPRFRAKQIFQWLHQKNVGTIAEMTTLSKPFQALLEEKFTMGSIKIQKKLVSALDGTVKYLYGLCDGGSVESVLMRYRHGDSLCVSTQAGCRMGCAFCASTIGGLSRNLTVSEMLSEVYTAQRDSGRRIGNVVLMGIGEPLDNFENTLDFLEILSHPDGMNLSLRHVSLSTCGLVDKIDALAEKKLALTLSVSLHAPNDEIRSQLMPVNQKWGVDALLAACRRYFDTTGRRISFEYALIGGVNDGVEHAKQLAAKLAGFPCHVNLIPVNEVKERTYCRGKTETVAKFRKTLEAAGINATVRRELGGDIAAACGQLRREQQQIGV